MNKIVIKFDRLKYLGVFTFENFYLHILFCNFLILFMYLTRNLNDLSIKNKDYKSHLFPIKTL
jgi:hypothetical protein